MIIPDDVCWRQYYDDDDIWCRLMIPITYRTTLMSITDDVVDDDFYDDDIDSVVLMVLFFIR